MELENIKKNWRIMHNDFYRVRSNDEFTDSSMRGIAADHLKTPPMGIPRSRKLTEVSNLPIRPDIRTEVKGVFPSEKPHSHEIGYILN